MKKCVLMMLVFMIGLVSFGQKLKEVTVLPTASTAITGKLQIGDPVYIQTNKQLIHAKTVLPIGYTIPTSWLSEQPPVQNAVVSLDTVAVTAMGTTTVTVVAAPGSGKIVHVIAAVIKLTKVSGTLEIGSQTINLSCETASNPIWKFPNGLIETDGSAVYSAIPETTSPTYVANKKIIAKYSAGTDATGAAKYTAKIYITYQIITL